MTVQRHRRAPAPHLLEEHFRVEGRRIWFETIEEMETVLDTYLDGYNNRRPHQGRGMHGRTPAQAFEDGVPPTSAKENPATTEDVTIPGAILSGLKVALSPRLWHV